jgi:expansin (peptidoglycan-binding protein)
MTRAILPASLACALAVACSSSSSSPNAVGPDGGSTTPPLSQPEQGIATYYAADGTGNCSFDASPNDLDVAAMDAPEWAGSAVCGECVAITGPKGNVTVRIVDQCPGCETGHLDLSQEAFAKIADVSAGRVPISWQVVACDVAGNLAFRFKEGSSQYWTAIQVRNSRYAIAKLEWSTGNGAFTELARQDYGYFVAASGTTAGPITVRTTAVTGASLVDVLGPVVSATVVNGAGQFPP